MMIGRIMETDGKFTNSKDDILLMISKAMEMD